jgi:DedD protein
MDQSLKARLIGAAVLVALAVILVPELLSGRKTAGEAPAPGESSGARTFTIELDRKGGRPTVQGAPSPAPAAGAGSRPPAAASPVDASAPPAPAPTPVQDTPARGGPAPTPAAGSPTERASASPAPASTEGAAAPTATRTPADQPAAGGGWLVQVGAFGTADAARTMVKDIEAMGLAAHVSPVTRGGRTLHRVRVGPVAGRTEAQQLAARLAARGLPATLVAGE